MRNPNEEDLIIQRQEVIEVRGLPLNLWSEENLKAITKEKGLWGWWINRSDTMD